MNWQLLVILICLLIILPLSIFRDRKLRREYCSCNGCQNDESGWLSEEYKRKYPECKMR